MEYFYYFRDKDKRPLVTVCLLEKDGEYARGVAYCSFKDNPSKKVGRNIAKGRAVRALIRGGSNDAVIREEAFSVARTIGLQSYFGFKSSFPANLSEWEMNLVGEGVEEGGGEIE